MKKFLSEFKEFAMRGNVMDMAVGVVIGAAFGKIVTNLVAMIMSLVGLFSSELNFAALALNLKNEAGEVFFSFPYGAFLQSVLEFVIIAFCVFMVIKLINKFKTPPAPVVKETVVEASKEELLLSEIRDLLTAQSK